ncbi:MAG: ABC transporter permease [Nitrospirales bacterium]
MAFIDHWRDILVSLRRHKLRTFLTAFGVFWGILMVVVLLGIGKGLERGIAQIFKDDAYNSIWIRGAKASIPYAGLNPGRPIILTIHDLEALKTAIPGIENLTPRKQLKTEIPVKFGRKTGAFEIQGIYPGNNVVEKTILVEGRLINPLDVAEARRVAVIGARVVEILFGESAHPVGQRIDIHGTSYLVVGTFTDVGGEGELRRIYLPFTAFQRSFDPSPDIEWLIFTVKDGFYSYPHEDRVLALLAERHRFSPSDRGALDIWNVIEDYKKFQSLFFGIHVFVMVVGMGTLFAGLVGVTNVMFIAVKERTREIGIRKALGATPRTILGMILQEALMLTLISGYLGLVAGIGVIELLRSFGIEAEYFRDPEVDLGMAFGALFVLIIGGVAAGLIPARYAARIHPIEALRHE